MYVGFEMCNECRRKGYKRRGKRLTENFGLTERLRKLYTLWVSISSPVRKFGNKANEVAQVNFTSYHFLITLSKSEF